MEHTARNNKKNNAEKNVSCFKFHVSGQEGFTLYEVLIYLALFFTLAVLVVGSVMQLLGAGFRSSRSREVVSSVKASLDAFVREAKFAQSVYAPTSVFGTDSSQVSLETSVDPPQGETTSFVDIYLDNGRIYVKRERENARVLTSGRVFVDRLFVRRFDPTISSEALQVNIAAHHRSSRASDSDAFSATTTVALRRY